MWSPLGFDVVVVLAFVVIGRDTHDESGAVADVLRTATPFLAGTAAGWSLPITRNRPWSPVAGVVVAAAAVVAGMAVRRLIFSDGIAASFVVVATLFLSGGFVGWRYLAGRIRGRPVDAGGIGPDRSL